MTSSPDEDFQSRIFIINGGILLLFALLISIPNGLLLFVMYKDPLKTFRNSTAIFVLALGITDLLTGCVTAVDVGICHILEGFGIQYILLQAKLTSQCTVRASLLIITTFAVERFIAVAFPNVYRFSVTIRKTIIACILCWVLAIFTSCLELLIHRDLYDVIFLYLVFILPLITVCVTYFTTYWLMKNKTMRMRPLGKTTLQAPECGSMRRKKGTEISELSLKLRAHLMKTALLIIFVFVVSLLPFWSFTMIGRYCKSCTKERWFVACYRFSIPVMYINSALNPFLYAWRIRSYRRSFQVLFERKRDNCRNSRPIDETLQNKQHVTSSSLQQQLFDKTKT